MDIVHELIIRTERENVYQVLTEPVHLAAWFTPDTRAEAELAVGSIVEFHFDRGVIRVQITELEPYSKVVWKILAGLPGWEGVTGEMIWRLINNPYGSGTMLHFTHTGWKANDGPYPSSNFKIATLILNLKNHAETGILSPA